MFAYRIRLSSNIRKLFYSLYISLYVLLETFNLNLCTVCRMWNQLWESQTKEKCLQTNNFALEDYKFCHFFYWNVFFFCFFFLEEIFWKKNVKFCIYKVEIREMNFGMWRHLRFTFAYLIFTRIKTPLWRRWLHHKTVYCL